MTRAGESLVLTDATLQTGFAEAYRVLRTNLGFAGVGRQARSILVTSGAAGEGKSTIVVNLGILLAQAGHEVLLVDADFRRPSLEWLLPIAANSARAGRVEAFWQRNSATAAPGLSNLIAGTATFAEAARQVRGVDHHTVLPSGNVPARPAELLGSERMATVMTGLEERADLVLVDSPPCSTHSDALQLTEVTDAVLYVLRSGPQGTADHLRILKQLQQGRAHLIGIVMNQVERNAGGYEGPYRGRSDKS